MKNYQGLTEENVRASRLKNGSNALTAKPCQTFWSRYWSNFEDPIITILLAALTVNVFFSFWGKTEWFEAVGICLAVLISTVVTTLSEHSNEAAFQKIQRSTSRIICKAYRNGRLENVGIDEIVTGDFILLQAGDMVPADGFMIEGGVSVDQSGLNGETKEAEKRARIGSSPNSSEHVDFWDKHKLFRGTVICSGEGVFQVSEVGDDTVYGGLANETQIQDRESPIKVKLAHLAKSISRFGYLGGVCIGLIYLFQTVIVANGFNAALIAKYIAELRFLGDLMESLTISIIVIVMAVPEGLPLMIAIVCSLNMRKMLKDNVLVRKLVGIETAGGINVLFSDKTGTITRGRLDVVRFISGEDHEYAEFSDINAPLRRLVALSATHNTSAVMSGKEVIGGNATEKALLRYVNQQADMSIPIIKRAPFNSRDKYSAAKLGGGRPITLIKGAPEQILPLCRGCYDREGNKCALTSGAAIERTINRLAGQAIRVLALATSDNFTDGRLAGPLTLIGVIAIKDEVRPEAVAAIKEVRGAGVHVVMVTGDKKETAVAIANEAGLMTSPDAIVLSSSELAMYTDEQVKKLLNNICVIARALPNDKSRLVRIAQEMDLVVGMTGDGVNDAPALKRADVGFAMGSGTDVAKEAGDIIIVDDNFLSIKKAILYGRTIYNNIKKFVTFQLTINVSAVLVSVAGSIFGIKKPLDITQMLWINLVMDTLGALAFGGEAALKRYLSERPKKRDEKIIDKTMWSAIIVDASFICVMSIFFLKSPFIHAFFRPDANGIYLYTGYFAFFIFICIMNGFNARTDSTYLLDHISVNKGFMSIMSFVAIVQVLMTYLGGAVLRTNGLTAHEWVVVLLLSILIIPVDLLRKAAVEVIKERRAMVRVSGSRKRELRSSRNPL